MTIGIEFQMHIARRTDFGLLLRKGSIFEDAKDKRFGVEEELIDFRRICCPKCKWRPTASSRWFCADSLEPEFYLEGCGTCWNTFETQGKCPGCQHQWRWTSCLSCSGWSLHGDWYRE